MSTNSGCLLAFANVMEAHEFRNGRAGRGSVTHALRMNLRKQVERGGNRPPRHEQEEEREQGYGQPCALVAKERRRYTAVTSGRRGEDVGVAALRGRAEDDDSREVRMGHDLLHDEAPAFVFVAPRATIQEGCDTPGWGEGQHTQEPQRARSSERIRRWTDASTRSRDNTS